MNKFFWNSSFSFLAVVMSLFIIGFNINASEKKNDYERISIEIKEIADAMSKGILTKKKLFKICGHSLNEKAKKKFFECGDLETSNYKLRIMYSLNEKITENNPLSSIHLNLHKIGGLTISSLVKTIGKWVYITDAAEQKYIMWEYIEEDSLESKVTIVGSYMYGPEHVQSLEERKFRNNFNRSLRKTSCRSPIMDSR